MKYAPFILIILWLIFISVYDKEWPRTNISYHDIDTLTYNQFAFPELLEEEDKKIIERFEYLQYLIEVDESKKRFKLNDKIKEKTKSFNFQEDVYINYQQNAIRMNELVLNKIENFVEFTTEIYLDRYLKRKKYDVHKKKLSDINN